MNIVASLTNLFGGGDMLIILLIVLILFGAKRLPELARGLGQAMNEFSKAKDDLHRQIATADEPPVRQPREVQEHRPVAAAQEPVVAENQVSPEQKPQV